MVAIKHLCVACNLTNNMKRNIPYEKGYFLVDMNAFYISCEMTRNKELRGVPAAWQEILKNVTGIILAETMKQGILG